MPAKSKPLVLEDSVSRVLRTVSVGETPAGKDVARRASVLLDLADGLSVRETAKRHGVRPNTVTEIRRRWEARGLDSLADAPRAGRPSKGASRDEVEAAADGFLAAWRESHAGEGPTVAEAAEGLGCSNALAREALAARGAVGTRRRSFPFPTVDDTESVSVELVGIYLSHSQQVAAVLVGHGPVSAHVPGSVSTGSSALAAELGRAADDDGLVGLADALGAAASTLATGGRGLDAMSFVRDLVRDNAKCGQALHLLACGEPVVADGRSVLVGVRLDVAGGMREWADSVGHLLRVLCPGDVPTAARIASGVLSFLRKAQPSTEPFRWSRGHADVYGTGAAVPPAPGTVEVTARVMGDDGKWVSCTSRANSNVTQSGFGVTPRAYVKSAGAVEQAVLAAGREAQRGATEAYLASIVKKS